MLKMRIPTYPDSYFKTQILMYINSTKLNEDGYNDFKYEIRENCCFNIGKLHKITEQIENTDYKASAVLKINKEFLNYYGIPKTGTCYVGDSNIEYNIVKAIPHMDFNGTIYYITFLLE